jgi:hypothetical protein
MMVPSWAQDTPTLIAQRHAQTRPPGAPPPTPAEIELEKRMAKERNRQRFVELKKDTDHLLELATQLKKSVDEANDQTLSLEVIRKAEQIEKLAKQVRQKMVAD